MQQHSTGPKPPNWHQLAGNFGDERECLASFLAMETAEVLEGVKPANLINLADRRQPCGRNLHQLWRRHHGRTMLRQSGLEVLEQPGRNGGLLLFIYRAEPLASLLGRRSTAAFLRQAGYPNPNDLQVALAELQSRLGKEKFPHEIGVFLGIRSGMSPGSWAGDRAPSPARGPGEFTANLSAASNWPRSFGRVAAVWLSA